MAKNSVRWSRSCRNEQSKEGAQSWDEGVGMRSDSCRVQPHPGIYFHKPRHQMHAMLN